MSVKKKVDERELLMERTAGLLALRKSGMISKRTEYAGFLTLMHPELSPEQVYKLARKLSDSE